MIFGITVGPELLDALPVIYFEGQIACIFCRVWREQNVSCFVWI